jgi:hypothetical protein
MKKQEDNYENSKPGETGWKCRNMRLGENALWEYSIGGIAHRVCVLRSCAVRMNGAEATCTFVIHTHSWFWHRVCILHSAPPYPMRQLHLKVARKYYSDPTLRQESEINPTAAPHLSPHAGLGRQGMGIANIGLFALLARTLSLRYFDSAPTFSLITYPYSAQPAGYLPVLILLLLTISHWSSLYRGVFSCRRAEQRQRYKQELLELIVRSNSQKVKRLSREKIARCKKLAVLFGR